MTDGDSGHSGRRSVLKAAVATLAAGVAAPALAQSAPKLSKQAVMYQDSPKNGQKCSECVQFVAPNACKIVEGQISPNGWCGAFQAKPA